MPFQKGYKPTEEHLKKMALARKGLKNALGCRRSEEWKNKRSEETTGKKHPQWKGGRNLDKDGYVLLYMPEHPNAIGKYIREHRYVMEQYLKRPLKSHEYVHHRNGIKDDNRLENLTIVLPNTHRGEVTCPHCLEKFFIQ